MTIYRRKHCISDLKTMRPKQTYHCRNKILIRYPHAHIDFIWGWNMLSRLLHSNHYFIVWIVSTCFCLFPELFCEFSCTVLCLFAFIPFFVLLPLFAQDFSILGFSGDVVKGITCEVWWAKNVMHFKKKWKKWNKVVGTSWEIVSLLWLLFPQFLSLDAFVFPWDQTSTGGEYFILTNSLL